MAGKLKDIPFGDYVPTIENLYGMTNLVIGTGFSIPIYFVSSSATSNSQDTTRANGYNLILQIPAQCAATACWAGYASEADSAMKADSVLIKAQGAGEASKACIGDFADEVDWAEEVMFASKASKAYEVSFVSEASTVENASQASYCPETAEASEASSAINVSEACETEWADLVEKACEVYETCEANGFYRDLTVVNEIRYDTELHQLQARKTTITPNGGWNVGDWSPVENGQAVEHVNS